MSRAETWSTVDSPKLIAGTLWVLALAALGTRGDRWVPVLDAANLMFHEAGHPLFGMLSERLGVYGGTLGQLVFPLAVSIHFWWKRYAFSFYMGLVWIAQNFWNISRYMADARAQELPLVGNGDRLHDWNEIFGNWNLLDADTRLAGYVLKLGALIALLAWCWLLLRWQLGAGGGATRAKKKVLVVRRRVPEPELRNPPS